MDIYDGCIRIVDMDIMDIMIYTLATVAQTRPNITLVALLKNSTLRGKIDQRYFVLTFIRNGNPSKYS